MKKIIIAIKPKFKVSYACVIRCIDCFYFAWWLVQIEKSMKPLRPYERRDTLKQFLDYDRNVLRFFCIWDDTESVFVELRELILHYFLADDTIEIREVIPPNSGRDTVSKFLCRSKLPKVRHHDRMFKKFSVSLVERGGLHLLSRRGRKKNRPYNLWKFLNTIRIQEGTF